LIKGIVGIESDRSERHC